MLSTHFARIWLAISLILPIPALAEEELDYEDVPVIMDKLLDYHVQEDEISPEVIRRSLKAYIKDFDPEKVYFLDREVAPYLNASDALVSRIMQGYEHDDFTAYAELQQIVVSAITRSQEWQKGFATEEKIYVAKAEALEKKEHWSMPKTFADSEAELKARQEERFVYFIRGQEVRLGHDLTEEESEKVFRLYQRRRLDHEDGYLSKPNGFEDVVAVRTLKALAKSLDSHTAYFSAEEAYDMRARLEKGIHGIGVVLQEGLDGIVVVRVIDGGPASKSGAIAPTDRVVEVDGTDVRDIPFHGVLDLIRGEEGSSLELGIVSDKEVDGQMTEDFERVKLTRERIELNEDRVDVSHVPFGDGILGVVALHAFYENKDGVSSENDIRKALKDLAEEGPIKGLILDMRDNRGGFLMEAVKVAGLFMTNGVVVVSKYSDGSQRYFRDIDGYTYYDGPLVVLVSKASASAAEIVAQSLQDYGAAVVVGDSRTYGKGSIQHQNVTDASGNNAYFKVTVGRYYTASGNSTQIDGVPSDIIVPSLFNQEEIGEEYLEYPLPTDSIAPSFNDSLSDIDEQAREWFWRYYMPTLEKQDDYWKNLLPVLRENSRLRLEESANYQAFLKAADKNIEKDPDSEENWGMEDPQIEESLNVLKDMVQLQSEERLTKLYNFVTNIEAEGEETAKQP